jgi:hypothetical protein
VSSTWSSPPRPRRPRACGHWQCACRRLAGGFLLITAGAAFILVAIGIGLGTFLAGWFFAGLLASNLGFAVWCWPHPPPGGDEAGIETLMDAIRECRCCSPQDTGPCTCAEDCGSIRCTAWIHAATCGQSPYQDFTKWEQEL